MRTGRLALILATALTLASGSFHRAFAEGGEEGTTVAAPGHGGEEQKGEEGKGEEGPRFIKNSNSTVVSGNKEVERPLERHERPVFEKETSYYGSTKDGKAAKKGQGYKNQNFRDPVYAENDKGKLIVKEDPNRPSRDGKSANRWDKKTNAAHENDEKRFEGVKGVTIISTPNVKDAVGINAGPFKNGRDTLVEGKYGEVNLDVGRVDYEGSAGVSITNKGVMGQAGGKVVATLVGIQAETKTFGTGDPNGLNYAGGQLEGRAYIGGDAEADLKVKADTTGVAAHGELGGFLGGKAEAQGAGTAKICGVAVNLTGVAEASYGIGAKADGTFAIDWSKMSVRVGVKASATLGGGLGAGGTVEVSLADVLKDPKAAADCVAEHLKEAGQYVVEKGGEVVDAAKDLGAKGIQKLSDAADSVQNTVSNGYNNAKSTVSGWYHGIFGGGDDDSQQATGSNVARNESTVPTMSAASPAGPGITARDAIGTKR